MGLTVFFGVPALPAGILGVWEFEEKMVVMNQGASS